LPGAGRTGTITGMNTTALLLVATLLSSADVPLGAADVTALIGADLDAWRKPTGAWLVAGSAALSEGEGKRLVGAAGTGVILNGPEGRTSNLLSTAEFGDAEIHVEWLVAKGSNSGVYVMGRYEVQILDSFGNPKPGPSDAGGIYQRWDPKRGAGKEGYEGTPPRVNAAKPAGEWQTYDISFRAPRFDAAGAKAANAVFVKVVHNGQTVHENVEVTGPTRSAMWEYEPEKPLGPLMLQGDHGPVAYRNITIKPLAAAP
jgi:hypothetical protein